MPTERKLTVKTKVTLDDLNISAELRDNLRKVMGWYSLTEEYIISRAVEKYWQHHKNKVDAKDIKRTRMGHLYRIQNRKCYYCGVELTRSMGTLDHKVPLAKGGSSEIDNLVIACEECNIRKADLTADEYRHYLRSQEKAKETLIKLLA